MDLKSLTYTSLARLDITADDIAAIHRTAREINALEGITGLLIFNGTHFLQNVEGSAPAIDELLERLRQDERHHQLEVRDEHIIAERLFPDWSMELVRVSTRYSEARATLVAALPPNLPDSIGSRILAMTERISTSVRILD